MIAISTYTPQSVRQKSRMIFAGLAATVLLTLFLPLPARAAEKDWSPLVERLQGDGFCRQSVETIFSRPEVRFEPDAMSEKIRSIIRNQTAGPAAAARRKHAVRGSYLNRVSIARARSCALENLDVLERIQVLYGVPKEIVISILLIETDLGRNTGSRCVFNRLASMAIHPDLESLLPHLDSGTINESNEAFARRRCREKAEWAYEELKALLRLADRDGLDPLGIRGSIYGAIGLCQFMPTNVFHYGVDADNDGRIDPFAMSDALHSIANYLRGHGWRPGMNRDDQHRVIFDYNHSTVYANTVLAVAEKLKERKRTGP